MPITRATHAGGPWWSCNYCHKPLEARCNCCEPPLCNCQTAREAEDLPPAVKATLTYHIRVPLPPRGGNQFYRDNSPREARTYCGADCTEYDAAGRYVQVTRYRHTNGHPMQPCQACVKARVKENL